ncbi:MAG: TetR/AcrR family transcriptional regulator [Candidatus Eisenbacteria bacterium]|uniref:TetR/AcrR family transcriptional regulator n=1 Tax=Eiseniibacteriota bacterium TaxID=2212470 RepID=A0A933W8Y3_UNCEI|nr:TetR/AcrR family transcriptional regulator [Candidatus Eisenbacteria bacterium]
MSTPELSRRERKKEDTRRRIFEAAVSLFREKGFEATTVDEITEKADVGRGTFFNYFPKKDSVLAFLSEEKLIVAEENLHELLNAPSTAREKLIGLYCAAGAVYEQDLDLARYVFSEWLKRGFAPTQDVERRWQKITLDLIQQGLSNGELREDVEPLRAEAILSSVYVAAIFQFLFCPADCAQKVVDLRDEIAARFAVVFDGLTPRTEVRP